jgi:uncharacterized RDD family membrane protein YckC
MPSFGKAKTGSACPGCLANLTTRRMNCPICGSPSPCIHSPGGAVVLTDHKDENSGPPLSREEAEHDLNWRKEVASRVQQHRYRRTTPGDTAEAMELEFAGDEALTVTDGPVIRALHRRSVADDQVPAEPPPRIAGPEGARVIRFPRMLASLRELEENDPRSDSDASAAIEPGSAMFPRIMEMTDQPPEELTPPEELARPEVEPTRTPEQMELLPSFDDIQLEPAYSRTQPDFEIALQPAPLQERFIAGVVDIGLVALGALLFGYSFLRMSEDTPHSRLSLLLALCVGGILWVVFQYLFLVHGRGTPGMRFAQLELRTFEGKPVNTNMRRVRAAASALSALSVGLGYAWALVDEDQLGWHDKMTSTLLRSSTQESAMDAHPWD